MNIQGDATQTVEFKSVFLNKRNDDLPDLQLPIWRFITGAIGAALLVKLKANHKYELVAGADTRYRCCI